MSIRECVVRREQWVERQSNWRSHHKYPRVDGSAKRKKKSSRYEHVGRVRSSIVIAGTPVQARDTYADQ
jgi:hypothetical protein